MDELDLYDDESYAPRAEAEAEKHLRSPILSSLLDRLIALYNTLAGLCMRDRDAVVSRPYISRNVMQHFHHITRSKLEFSYSGLSHIAQPFIEDMILTSKPPSIVDPRMYKDMFSRSIVGRRTLNESLANATELYRSEIRAFKEWATPSELQQMAELELNFDPNIQTVTYVRYEQYRYWDLIVERYRSAKKKKRFGKSTLTLNGISFFFYDGFIMEQHGAPIVTGKKRSAPPRYIYTYEQAQMFQDACLARFNAFLAIDANLHNADESIGPILESLLQWQEDVLTRYGNNGYELVKAPEAICKAYLNTLTNGDILLRSSFTRTVAKIKKKEVAFDGNTEYTDKLVDIIQSTKNLSNVAELFGCTKLSGHPFVYAEKSAKSVQGEAIPVGSLDLITIRDYHNIFKFLILSRYLQKHKTWPPFYKDKKPKENTRLHELWSQNILYLTPKSFPLIELTEVEFGKFMEFDYSPDYLDMIDDKAINPGGKNAAGFWFTQESSGYRRLLEALIKKEDVDTVAIVNRMRRGNFYLDERVIELTQKEREFKTSARCFCKLTFEVRLFFVLTEANLKRFMGGASGVDGYLPQQTMTMSNIELRRRLYELTSPSRRNNTCMIEVDFSRWNLRWRAASVNPISRTLEKIFGLPGVFSQAHFFFENSTVVVTDKHTLPKGIKPKMPAHKWPTSDLVWRGHRGGFEGIQQTLWTICTITMMYYSLRDEECSFIMAGQGDNQVFHLTFNLTNNATLSAALLKLLTSLERECAKLNHAVKPEECVDSSTVLTYGKEIYAEGVHIQYSLKFSSRAFARLDHSVPSLSKEIASVVSNSISTSSTLKNTLRAVWWKHIQVLLTLQRRINSPLYSMEKKSILELLKTPENRKILLIPGSLGGLPMMPWTRYFSKGETDDLSFDVAATYYLSRHEVTLKKYMGLLTKGEFTPNKVDVTNLINDPHSVPIDRPNDSSHLVADIVGKRLPNLVKNRDIRPLVNPTLRTNGEKYKEFLTQMRPLYPQIAADLFELTPAGLYNKTVKRFSMTRTIEKLVPGISIEERVTDSNVLMIQTLLRRWRLASRASSAVHSPPYITAQKLRDLWGIDLKNSSIGIYTPFDFRLDYSTMKHSVISASVNPEAKILTTKGKKPPNFGTSTIMKKSDHGYRIVNCNSTMRDLKSAVLIYSELQADPSIDPLINNIVHARSPWNLSQLVPLFPTQYGGTSVHRHAASRNHFAVLGSCSVPTHINLSSDRAGILSGGEADYPVVFQTMYLTLINLYQNLAAHNVILPSSLAYLIPDTLDPIDVSSVKYPSNSTINPLWPSLRGNKLAWVEDIFATEVPTVPDPTIITHIKNPKSLDLVFSYVETKVVPNLDNKKIWDGVLSPHDIFDFKEISRVNPYDVETALSWVVLTDTYADALARIQAPKRSSISDILHRKSILYAGAWIRIRLHPSFLPTEYNVQRLIALAPTEIGYKKPVEYMAYIFRKRVYGLIRTAGQSTIPTLILFNNWTEKAASLAKRRIAVMHILATQGKLPLQVLREEIIKNSPPVELLERDPTTFLYAASRPLSKRVLGREYILPEVRNAFMNMSPEEAFRTLRVHERADVLYSLETISRPLMSNHGLVRITLSPHSGICIPNESDDMNHLPVDDRIRILKRRTIGATSPLYSDWNAILHHVIPQLYGQYSAYHIFGVGRGAVARFLDENRLASIGYDLRNTFPDVAHRSASYIPPELALHGRGSHFVWSDHTFRTDGNVLEGHLDIFDSPQPAVAIVDLDVSMFTLVTFLRRLPVGNPAIIRFRGPEEQIKYVCSLILPDKLYALTIVNNQVVDAVLCTSKLNPIGTGNYLRICFSKLSELSYKNDYDEFVLQLLDIVPDFCKNLDISPDSTTLESAQKIKEFLENDRSRIDASMKDYWSTLNRNKVQVELTSRLLRMYAVCSNILEHYMRIII